MSALTIRPQHENERNQDATVYIGNLDERVDDSLIWELMLQAGPLAHVHLPRDRVNGQTQGFGFAEFVHETDADYASNIMNQIRLFGKPIRVNKASADKQKNLDVGAELFIGNLDHLVDEKLLLDTFAGFGNLISSPKVARNELGESRGFGFVSYDGFDASDRALESMNGQFLMNRPCTVAYAFKRDGKGERHGDPAERLLAQQAKKNNYALPRPPPPLQQQQQQQQQSAATTPGVVIPPPPLPAGGLAGGAPLGYPGQPPPQVPPTFNQYPPVFTTTTTPGAPPPPPPGFSSANVVIPPHQQQQQQPPPSLPPGFSTARHSPYGTPTPPPGASHPPPR